MKIEKQKRNKKRKKSEMSIKKPAGKKGEPDNLGLNAAGRPLRRAAAQSKYSCISNVSLYDEVKPPWLQEDQISDDEDSDWHPLTVARQAAEPRGQVPRGHQPREQLPEAAQPPDVQAQEQLLQEELEDIPVTDLSTMTSLLVHPNPG